MEKKLSTRNQHQQPLHLSVITFTSGTEGPWWKLEEGGCGEEGRTKVTTGEFVVVSLKPANSLCIFFRNSFKVEYLKFSKPPGVKSYYRYF